MTIGIDAAPLPDRIVPLSGGHNFRDIGGYASADGRRIRWRQVYRSGTMAELSDADHGMLDEIGLRVVCDLRTTSERSHRPSRLPANMYDMWARDYEMSDADLVQAMAAPAATADQARQRMQALYRTLPYEQADAYRELFARLADGPLPLVFHCSAGKDRTGVAAALLLDLLGVDRATVIEDYTLTDRFFSRGCQLVRSDPIGSRLAAVDPAIWEPMMRASPAYLETMFEALESRHGSASCFVRDEMGVTPAMAEAIRGRLLE